MTTFKGGLGIDTLSYAFSTKGITVDLDTTLVSGVGYGLAASSGAFNEIGTDAITGIENVIGGFGSDSLTGDSVGNGLLGDAGEGHAER